MNLDSWKIKNTLEKSEHLKFYEVFKMVQKRGLTPKLYAGRLTKSLILSYKVIFATE